MNIGLEVQRLIDDLKKSWEFNNIALDIRKTNHYKWSKTYASFEADIIDLSVVEPNVNNDSENFDEELFWDEFMSWLKSCLSGNVEIMRNPETGQIEIQSCEYEDWIIEDRNEKTSQ